MAMSDAVASLFVAGALVGCSSADVSVPPWSDGVDPRDAGAARTSDASVSPRDAGMVDSRARSVDGAADGGGASDALDEVPPPVADATVSDGAAAPPSTGSDAAPPNIALPPARGAWLGAFVGVGTETEPVAQSEQLFRNEEGLIGRTWWIDNRFYTDADDWVNDRTKWDIANGKVPLITWMPYYGTSTDPLGEVVSGQHDAALRAQAQGAKSLGASIFLRWAHEMNGGVYPWSGAASGGASAPPKYVAAWKHVHDLFAEAGATNVKWVWCIQTTDVPSASWNHWTNYYPGDDYVDWVGFDAYNWGTVPSCKGCGWQSFQQIIDAPYANYGGGKPIIIAETASTELGGNKAAWIAGMGNSLKAAYTGVKAVVWFDIDKETDWRVASSPASLAAYEALGADPYFNP
jgi:hypothetical protein